MYRYSGDEQSYSTGCCIFNFYLKISIDTTCIAFVIFCRLLEDEYIFLMINVVCMDMYIKHCSSKGSEKSMRKK